MKKKYLYSLLTIYCIILTASTGLCEYRVYQYYVKSKLPSIRDIKAYIVTSTLDPVSYLAYHGGSSALKIDPLRTWMCKGDTARKNICKSPFDTLAKK